MNDNQSQQEVPRTLKRVKSHAHLCGRFLLTIVASLCIAYLAPPSSGQDLPSFAAASVRLNAANDERMSKIGPMDQPRLTLEHVSMSVLVQIAFGVDDRQIEKRPAWFDTTYYDVSAVSGDASTTTYEQVKPRMQRLLSERFGLTAHSEQRASKGFALVVAGSTKGAALLKAAPADAKPANVYIFANGIQGNALTMDTFCHILARPLGHPVEDRTGLKGGYNIDLKFAPLDGTESTLPALPTALREQLGLRLQPADVPVKVLVIDKANRTPTEN